jgi:hypothetical protein
MLARLPECAERWATHENPRHHRIRLAAGRQRRRPGGTTVITSETRRNWKKLNYDSGEHARAQRQWAAKQNNYELEEALARESHRCWVEVEQLKAQVT